LEIELSEYLTLLILAIIIVFIAGLILIFILADRHFAAPRYRGPITDHFDGRRFHNLEPPERRGFIDFLRWQLTSKRGYWNKWTDSQPGSVPSSRVNGDHLRVTFVNHASVLIQTKGLNILTDPIWSERASPVDWAGPKRHRSPGLRFEDLPPIDVVLISHNHYDHLDIKTLIRLRDKHQSRFVSGMGNREFLRSRDITEVTELDWWEAAKLSDELAVTCVPAKHFSGRALSDSDATLWCGYVLQGSNGNIYFAGDTGMGNQFVEIKDRFAPFRLAILPIGAYLPRWFMHPVHISPSDAVEVHDILEARVSLAMHFGTFALGDDGEFEPIIDLREALKDRGKSDALFWILDHGEGRDVP
jgi:L-ascorbate metabolism protein UlaG (beta-lactamase superfamily)